MDRFEHIEQATVPVPGHGAPARVGALGAADARELCGVFVVDGRLLRLTPDRTRRGRRIVWSRKPNRAGWERFGEFVAAEPRQSRPVLAADAPRLRRAVAALLGYAAARGGDDPDAAAVRALRVVPAAALPPPARAPAAEAWVAVEASASGSPRPATASASVARPAPLRRPTAR